MPKQDGFCWDSRIWIRSMAWFLGDVISFVLCGVNGLTVPVTAACEKELSSNQGRVSVLKPLQERNTIKVNRQEHLKTIMDDYDIRSAASILASVKEQEARFERLTRALEEERRNVSLQLERANQPADRMSICNIGNGQPLATAWQQLVLQGRSGTDNNAVDS
ncbi:armadillo repeat protein deleted in velo-cardio-facial syndrome [Grus japonensis]|uniref:Armadillo repeat protein deleted in velo-cardio-facial syndrome n=1 Tax=Grus japonensis TaxID=30415 RepID=A0ABC9XGZ8_GRUJA